MSRNLIAILRGLRPEEAADIADALGDAEITALDTTGTLGTVTLNGDALVELTETFSVLLSSLSAGGRSVTIADDTGVGTTDTSANMGMESSSVA